MAEKNMKYEPLDPDEKLLAEVNEKLKTDPCNPELWYQKGLQHTWKGENEMALHCFSTGLIYAPFHASLRTWRGRKLMGQSDYTMAISELATASALNPMDWEAWYYQGVAAYLEGLYEHAKMCHTKARHLIAKHDPLCLAATVDWYWMTCMKLGERDEAKRVVDILCHAEGYRAGIASNHADVEHWWPRHGKTMDDFRAAVKAALGGDGQTEPEEPQQPAAEQPADWAAEAWAWAKAMGLLDGTRPTAASTRQEVAVMFRRFYEAVKAGK